MNPARGKKLVLPYGLFCLLLFLGLACKADLKPLSFVKNFSSEETGAHHQNWKIIQDQRGFIYSGNHAGILVFNGKKWSLYSTSTFSEIKSLHLDKIKQQIFYGGVGEFGVFEADQKGLHHFKALNVDTNEFNRTFADIWKIHQLKEDIYFQSFAAIFRLSKGRVKAILPEKEFHLSFMAGEQILLQEPSAGLKVLQGDRAVLLKGGEFFKSDKIYSILPISGNEFQLISRKYGLIKITVFPDEVKINSSAYPQNLPNDIYCGLKISDSLYAYGSLSEGLFLLNASGEIQEVFNIDNGLKNQSIKDIFLDAQNGIWLALESGITRIDHSFPLRFFSGGSGLSASVQSIANFDKSLYIATSECLSKSVQGGDKGGFTEIPGIKNQVFQLLKFRDDLLLASGIDGIFSIGNNAVKRTADYRAYSLAVAPWDSSLLMIGCVDGLAMLKFKEGLWQDAGYVNEEEVQIRRLAFDERGDLWYSAADTLIKRISKKNLQAFAEKGKTAEGKVYKPKSSFPTSFSIQPFFVSGKLLVGGHGEIYTYQPEKDALVPYLPGILSKSLHDGEVFRIFSENNRLWIWQNNPGNNLLGYLPLDYPEIGLVSGLFSILKSKVVQDIATDGKGNILFGTSDGLYFFNPRHRFPNQEYPALIQEVVLNGRDTLIMNFTGDRQIPVPEIAYRKNAISFSYSALFFSSPELTKYSCRLVGFDSTFTAWTTENRRSFTNLPEGDYVFEIKALNIVGRESLLLRYAFTILPPWYRTGWAYVGYLISTVLLTLGIVRMSVYRLTKTKKLLEQKVKSRTFEVVRQKEEIEKQKQLVELRNKDITDSINYAQRIQQAILPLREEIKSALPDTCILFLPRDIVSGDFFWFSGKYQKSHQYIFLAAVDCTGHGVPGAFMSMIGNTLLNEIVNEKAILEPSLILQSLNEGVRRALKQNNEEHASRDGMDLALIRINILTREILFSGANRPLWIIKKDNSFIEIRPDKLGIGGFQNTMEKQFSTKAVRVDSGDRLYIFTDGYADQFGGPQGKKFMVKKLQQTLIDLNSQHIRTLDRKLEEIHRNWKGDLDQIDDILVIGFSLPENVG